ncbi:hypothetical protein COV53_02935 [Candidatus Gottesmanbacteria bacterium CG11_big_fil_rev_8_21_14_0_20_37_11]|nr:MAG: hypothetical protein COV53_02935 [Candidatus Gottesmanbacteria bacterium CG11_big_fil_rev_8_21_14_0_20_37_11]
MAKIWIGFCLGVWCLKKLNFGKSKGWAMVAGLMIYYILAFIPVFGWFFKMFSLFAGVGVFYLEIVEVYKLISAKKIA